MNIKQNTNSCKSAHSEKAKQVNWNQLSGCRTKSRHMNHCILMFFVSVSFASFEFEKIINISHVNERKPTESQSSMIDGRTALQTVAEKMTLSHSNHSRVQNKIKGR